MVTALAVLTGPAGYAQTARAVTPPEAAAPTPATVAAPAPANEPAAPPAATAAPPAAPAAPPAPPKPAPRPPVKGYTFYAKADLKIGETAFKAAEALLVSPQVLDSRKTGGKLEAQIVFQKSKNGLTGTGETLTGWVALESLARAKPAARLNPNNWTKEPGASTKKAEPPAPCLPGDELCADTPSVIYAFHNSDLCQAVNLQTDPNGRSRRDLLLEAWDRFIADHSRNACKGGVRSEDPLCVNLRRAQDVDILTRTAIFEAEPPNKGLTAERAKVRQNCERDIILLTLRNRAFDPTCANVVAGKTPKYGCRFEGDFTGVSTKPTELNIWRPMDTLNTRITGCFLRRDAETATWTDPGGRKSFFQRKAEYVETLPRALRLIDPKTDVNDLFAIETGDALAPAERTKLLLNTKFYYHPVGMAKCDPRTYDQTVFVKTAIARKGDELFLISETRFVPAKDAQGRTTIGEVYRAEGGLPAALHDEFYPRFAGAAVEERALDRTHNNRCWPPVGGSSCKLSEKLGARKAPKWAIVPGNETARISCLGDKKEDGTREEPWTWNGLCDPDMVVIPDVILFYRLVKAADDLPAVFDDFGPGARVLGRESFTARGREFVAVDYFNGYRGTGAVQSCSTVYLLARDSRGALRRVDELPYRCEQAGPGGDGTFSVPYLIDRENGRLVPLAAGG